MKAIPTFLILALFTSSAFSLDRQLIDRHPISRTVWFAKDFDGKNDSWSRGKLGDVSWGFHRDRSGTRPSHHPVFFLNGKRHTGWIMIKFGYSFSFSGDQTRALGQLKDGKLDGLSTWWYDSAVPSQKINKRQKLVESNYKDGKLDGLSTSWHENGQKKWAGNFKNGKRDGFWASWDEDGQKRSESNYKHGRLNGQMTLREKIRAEELLGLKTLSWDRFGGGGGHTDNVENLWRKAVEPKRTRPNNAGQNNGKKPGGAKLELTRPDKTDDF